ncbi:hypothetical protein FHS16_004394 [Paenibacillus endophyticus]|uniref:Lipoprotein n=1 Tax=Paenibacillus endophyticus TaxID=1294268 RepID=A0A7W5CB36_9BACL|nr:hypothetical protein [Paenibacillus endophyticus]MBB3154312.1 hypothetical protein [Paenibacillus endophyticus]
MKLWQSILLLGMLTACSGRSDPFYDENAGYKPSTVNNDFIVPLQAESEETKFSNPNILKGLKYNLKDVGGLQGLYPPMHYFEELERLGWMEQKEERMGHAHFFKKETTVMSVIVKEDFFHVYEMKKTKQK